LVGERILADLDSVHRTIWHEHSGVTLRTIEKLHRNSQYRMAATLAVVIA